MKKKGYVDGKNIQIDFQNAQGATKSENISKQLAEESDLLRLQPLLHKSLANTTKSTPIVFSAVTDRLARIGEKLEPGGNITSDQSEDAIASQVDMIKQVLPTAKTVGILIRKVSLTPCPKKKTMRRRFRRKAIKVVEKQFSIVTMWKLQQTASCQRRYRLCSDGQYYLFYNGHCQTGFYQP